MTVRNARLHGLYAITDARMLATDRGMADVEAALRGGCAVLQYRDKSEEPARRLRQARILKDLCHEYNSLFIVNDDVELAAAVQADGIHLGRDDMDIERARAQLEPQSLIGISCYNSLQRALQAQAAGADYVAFGSFFPSLTKPQAVRATPELLEQARTRIRLPIVAIGGITLENAASLLHAGADMLAVITALFHAGDIEETARNFSALFSDGGQAS